MKTLLILLSATAALAQQSVYGQCGGLNWAGPFTCVAGTTCVYFHEYYSQCLPGVASTSSTSAAASSSSKSSSTKVSSSSSSVRSSTITSSSRSSTLTTSTRSSTTSSASRSSTTATSATSFTKTASSTTRTTITDSLTRTSTTTTTGPSTTATLQSGYLWIRAVEAPNFHSYLQSVPTGVPGPAVLASYTTAGQFQIVSGQLVQTTPSGLLYANVENPSNITGVVKLGMSFATTMNTFGTFAFSGDAVTWSVPTISRPNTSAWLVCENQSLYINLGNYAYLTPAGCVDETIHYYNDAVANS